MSRPRPRFGEVGSAPAGASQGFASVLILGITGAILMLALGLGSALRIAVAQARIQMSADLAAIAGSQTLRGISSGIPCERVRQIAQINMSIASECSIVGEEVSVAVRTISGGIVLSATATAVGY